MSDIGLSDLQLGGNMPVDDHYQQRGKPRLRLVKVAVQPFFVLDDGETITEVEHAAPFCQCRVRRS